MAEAKSKGSTMVTIKVIVFLVLLIIVFIIVLQNTEAVETKLLFATVTMPRALLLFTTTIIGFAAGVLVSLSLSKKRQSRG
jgi:putative membrane protein